MGGGSCSTRALVIWAASATQVSGRWTPMAGNRHGTRLPVSALFEHLDRDSTIDEFLA
jgi:hypothetical protein